MKNDKITVLIPTYNRKSFLRSALCSIFAQTHDNFQVLVYDDGSTDNTDILLEDFQMNGFPLEYIISETNRGVAYARNVLLDECETEFACWQDSDDLASVHRLKMQAEWIGLYDMVYTSFEKIDGNMPPLHLQPRMKDDFANASCMFRVDKEIRFNEELKIAEDNDWRRRMKEKYKVKYMAEALYYVRFHRDRLSVQYRHTRKRNLKEEAK